MRVGGKGVQLTSDEVNKTVQGGQAHVPEHPILCVLPEDGGITGQVSKALQLSQGAHTADSDGESVAWQQLLKVEGPCDLLQNQLHVPRQGL